MINNSNRISKGVGHPNLNRYHIMSKLHAVIAQIIKENLTLGQYIGSIMTLT